MKVLLVNPGQKKPIVHTANPPLGLLYLAASLLENNHEVKIIDADGGNLALDDIVKQAESFSPEVCGMSLYSPTLKSSGEIFEAIKSIRKNDMIYVFGGPHASAMPDAVFKQFPGLDYILRDEAESSFLNLLDVLNNGGSLEEVKGLSYRSNGRIFHNLLASLIEDLDTIPFPARHLLEDYYRTGKYFYSMLRDPIDLIMGSRGCPWRCNFCFRSSRKYRARSPENIMEEIISIVRRGIRNIFFLDDQMTMDKRRLYKLLDMIIDEKLDLTMKVRSRVDSIDEELLNKMKKAGVVFIVYGMESGSQRMLDLMGKKTTIEMNERACKLTKKAGIRCCTDWFLGYPGESPATIEQTIRFIMKIKPYAIQVADCFYPFPGTASYVQAKAEGTLMGDWSVDGEIPWVKLPWMKDKGDLTKYASKLNRKFYLRPIFVTKLLLQTIRDSNPRLIKIGIQMLTARFKK